MKKKARAQRARGDTAAGRKAPEAKARAGVRPAPLVPGQYFLRAEPIEANAGKQVAEIEVANKGDRPVQVGSHFHFFEVNRALAFDRERAYGMRLNIAAGTAIRFEPGQKKRVSLVALGGKREVWGLNGLVNGPLRPQRGRVAATKRS
jgi:urease subunit beta